MQSICAVICTRDRPQQLRRALQSLLAQTQLPGEIIVVDNAPSTDETKAIVTTEFGSVRYIQESAQGLDFARNRALAEASKEIVAFIDDDAVADPIWIETIQKTFGEYPKAGVCTGQISPLSLETSAQILFENNGGLMAQHRHLLRIPNDASGFGWKWRYLPNVVWAVSLGSGCNFSLRRSPALRIGGFDEALDLGEVMPGGGDHDMVWRMLDSGREVVYQPMAKVRHEHRRELMAVHEQIIGHHLSLIAFLAKTVCLSRGTRRITALTYLCWRLLKPGLRLFRRAFGRDALSYPVLARIWLHSWQGLVAYSTARKVADQRARNAKIPT